ncbi:MAG: hypothetical protein CMP28_06025 [Roseibacillus sp.]|nr:hypothetical protein [Roseibacillus sp.]
MRALSCGILASGLWVAGLPANPGPHGDPGWPGFRGNGTSTTTVEGLPLKWGEKEGIAWRSPLEGFGQSSPVIWQGRVYVTSTGGDKKEHLYLESFALEDGKRIWKREIPASEKVEEVTKMISQGAPTPVTGPGGVYAFYESGDLVAFDHGGNRLWSRRLTKEFGVFKGGHGVGSSLIGAPGRLLLLIDHDGPSYLLCLERATGKTIWKAEREPRVSWTSPLYLEHEGEGRVIISSNGVLEGYRLSDGKRLWWVENIQRNTVASPSSDGKLVVIGSSSPRQCLAVRLGGTGNVAKTHIAWRAESATSSFSSPLLHGETAYFVNRAGTLQAQRMKDGKQRWEYRLPDGCWASPLAAGERLYFFCKNGTTVVLDGKAEGPKPLGENVFPIPEGERIYGYAVGGKRFVVRSGREIVAIGQ